MVYYGNDNRSHKITPSYSHRQPPKISPSALQHNRFMSAKNLNYLRFVENLVLAVVFGLGLDTQSGVTQPAPSPQPEATPTQVEDLEINVYGNQLLNKPIYSPFRKEGTLKDSTRPAYVIDKNEIKAQGARTVREALQSLPGILGAGTVGTEINALSGQFIRGSNTNQVLILLDGRPINNLGSGGLIWVSFRLV